MADAVFASTPRLVWRQGRAEDVDALHAVVSDFDVVCQTETWPWPADRGFTEARCLTTPTSDSVLGVVTQEDELIGFLGIKNGGHLGYMFAKDHWGKGYATEIGHAAIEYAFSNFAWPQLEACVFADNPSSSRVLEKLGFEERHACEGPCAARGDVLPIRTFVRPRA